MGVILGVIFHFIGGFASGSFYMPYKKVRNWHWETFWLIGGLFSWLFVPTLAAYLTIPEFREIIENTSTSVLRNTFLMGLLWGIGGLMYGLGIRYLGMSLGNSVILGFCSAFGALVPSIYYDMDPIPGKISFTDMLHSNGGRLVLLGVVVCIIGIAICGRAGMLKEKELSEEKKQETEIKQLEGIINKLFPNDSLQERHDNFLNFYINNPNFINDVKSSFDPLDFRFNVLSYHE